MTAERTIETHALQWQGVGLEITWEASWLSIERSADREIGHLTITAVAPARAPLPITETGYRSHFVHPSEVEAEGGPLTYVTAWLNVMARSREWIAWEQSSRQLTLFK